MKKNCIKGRCYNISLNNKKTFLGWFLIISDNGQEYLVERNGTMSCGCFRKVYQTDYSFEPHTAFLNKSNNLPAIAGTSIGLILARMLRKIIPLNFFFGPINRPMNIGTGLVNIGVAIGTMVLAMFLVKYYRKKRLEFFLNKKGCKLSLIGKVRTKEPIKKLPNGIEVW
ncbi:hypothetical protein [Streptococcus sanguinis]|uniref:hypothetical protein n=1 Tax=Streptococcus sanguinis TaxID=1305 RepID=UPI0022848233|nr:hypothetical protein [Streptococcus sanguinis]MCY7015596.1 hypothetical protein [Streptococcus sanguinis]